MRYFLTYSVFLLLVISSYGFVENVNIPPELTAVKENQMVKLSWQTNPEIQTKHFILERSDDAIAFRTISILKKPNGHEDENLFVHMDELPMGGERYYRLKMIDNNGASIYSKVVRVRG
jgi:hypothetical protein